jgi:hypothetical protein
LLEHGVNLGDAMMLVATLAYAIYSTLLKKWQLKLPPLVLLYLQVLVAVVVLFPLFLASPKDRFDPAEHSAGVVRVPVGFDGGAVGVDAGRGAPGAEPDDAVFQFAAGDYRADCRGGAA